MKEMPKVSVCVLTYNPNKDELIETLKSIIAQEYMNLQIVVSDDGSTNPCFEEAEAVFSEFGFKNYVLIPAEQNQGTVRNVEKALQMSDGEYIKLISPGDRLFGKSILHDWVWQLMESGKSWSFSDVIYYMQEHGKAVACKRAAAPQFVKPYQKKLEESCRWNYVVLNDIAIGAATLCKKSLMLQYIRRIVGHVVYAEDHIYRMMMFDNITAYYFSQNTILYECSGGVSTSSSEIWKKRILNDWEEADKIMLQEANIQDGFQRKMAETILRRSIGKRNIFHKILEKGNLHLYLKRRLHMRTTDTI